MPTSLPLRLWGWEKNKNNVLDTWTVLGSISYGYVGIYELSRLYHA